MRNLRGGGWVNEGFREFRELNINWGNYFWKGKVVWGGGGGGEIECFE